MAAQMKQGMGRMNFFKGKNRVAGSCLVALSVFFGMFAPSVLADDTMDVDVSLTSYRFNSMPQTGHYIEIEGADFNLSRIDCFGMDLTKSCRMEKGRSYTLKLYVQGAYYDLAGGYVASISTDYVVVEDSQPFLFGDHQGERYYGPVPAHIRTATIHVPKITYKTYTFNPALYSWAPSDTTVILECEPADCLSVVDAALEWSAAEMDGTPVSVTPLGRLHCRVEVSPFPEDLYPFQRCIVLTAKYGGETVYGGLRRRK